MDEQSIFQQALDNKNNAQRAAWLDDVCGINTPLRQRIDTLLSSYEQAGSFLENPVPEFEATLIQEAAGNDRAQSLQAGLAAAFTEELAVVLGDGNHSVLKMLGRTLDKVPRVALRESTGEGDEPIVRPKSAEMPQRDLDSRYRLDGEIARGGMGAILKGRDTDLGRDLAIKVLLDQHKDKPDVVQRFIEEAQIGGQLQHPGIAPIYELGQFADKRPFFAMKLVKGETLSKLLADRKEAVAERGKFIGIFEQICQTMAYAHSRGVIHRDLKPANIMVGAFGEVQVMDWGLAKVLPAGGVADEKRAHDKQQGQSIIQTLRTKVGSDAPGQFGTYGSQTQMGSVMGTPAYMPPEQAMGEIDHLDERADVFGLGAILCEILTGKPPYVADDGTRLFRMAARGKLQDCFRRLDACGADEDLVALTKHCLELEPADRPRDAGALAERVTGYLESVETRLREAEMDRAAEAARAKEALHTVAETEARTRAERRARRLQLTMAAVVAVLTTIGALAAVRTAAEQARLKNDAIVAESHANTAREKAADQRALAEAAKTRAEEEKSRAETEKSRAEAAQRQADAEKIRSLNMLADMQTERGLQAGREGQSAAAALWFANAAALTPHDLERQRANQLRASSWLNEAIAPAAVLKLPDGFERRVEFQPHGSLLLTVGGARLRVWNWRNESVLPWSEALADVTDAVWSPDGKQIAIGFGTADVRIFDPITGNERKQFRPSERVAVIEWSPSGTRLAVGGLHAQVWNVADEPVQESDWSHPMTIFGLRFNRAETRLVTSCEDDFARVFAVGDQSLPSPLYAPVEHAPARRSSRTSSVFFDEDRRLVTVNGNSRMPVLHDATTGQSVDPGWTTIRWADYGLSVSPDRHWVATAGYLSGLLLAADGRSVELKHIHQLECASFTPDGQTLVTTCWDGTARWWPLHNLASKSPSIGSPITIPQMATQAICAISPDGSSLAISVYGQVAIWERPQSQLVAGQIAWQEPKLRPRTSFDGQFVTPGAWHSSPFVRQPSGGTLQTARMTDGQPAGPLITLDGLLCDSCLCADNRSVAAVTWNGTTGILGIFDVASGAPIIPSITLPDVPISVAARPGQPQVAVLCKNGSLLVIDIQQGSPRFDLNHDGWSSAKVTSRINWSPDGTTLLTVTPNHQVFVRNAETGELRFAPLQPVLEGGPCRAIAFSADSRLLATAVNGRNMVQVWDLMTGEKVGQQMPHPGDVWGLFSVAFSPDGQRILTGHKDGRARLWDWKAGEVVGTPMTHPDEVYDAQFTPDGRHVVTAVRHSSPQVWDVATQKPAVPAPQVVPQGVSSYSLAIAGDRVVVTSEHRYTVLDLSLLRQQPTHELTTLLTQAELATNQKLQLGELVPLEKEEWTARWEQWVAARPTPEEEAESLASAFDEAQTESMRRVVARRAIRFNLTERLQKLRPADPHLRIALAAELGAQFAAEGNWQRAIAMYDSLITDETADVQLLIQRATAHAELKRWDLAKADWKRASESKPDLAQTAFDRFKSVQRWTEASEFGVLLMKQKPSDSMLWVQIPPIVILAQDEGAYRSFCRGILENYRNTPTGAAAERAIKGCLLRPGAIDLTELPGDLLAQCLNDGTSPDGMRPWGWGSLALLAYRSGDAESAMKHITQSEQLKPENSAHAINLAVLALAQHQLKHPDEARKALDEASQVIRSLQAIDKNHHDLLIAEILYREAEVTINGKTDSK